MKHGTAYHIFPHLMLLLVPLIFLSTCGKSEFSPSTATQNDYVPGEKEYSTSTCSNFSLRKPLVDVVLLWSDTNHSNSYVSSYLKYSLTDLLNDVANYDYRVVAVPMTSASTSWSNAVIASYNGDKFLNNKTPKSINALANEVMAFNSGGYKEYGLKWLQFVANHTSDWHRSNAYTIYILVSFTDDEVQDRKNTAGMEVQTAATNFKTQLNNSQLYTAQTFFFSFIKTSNNSCWNYSGKATAYEDFSNQIPGKIMTDICSANRADFFYEISKTITDIVVPHRYRYWPISTTYGASINKDSIEVYIHADGGRTFVPPTRYTLKTNYNGDIVYQQDLNTRCYPSEGEPLSGYFIDFGKGTNTCDVNQTISYPNCITVKYTDRPVCYKFFPLASEPSASTIKVFKNGIQTGKYTYRQEWGFKLDQNVRVDCDNPTQPADVAEYKSGYFIEFDEPYTSGDNIKVTYQGTAKL